MLAAVSKCKVLCRAVGGTSEVPHIKVLCFGSLGGGSFKALLTPHKSIFKLVDFLVQILYRVQVPT